MDTKMGKSVWEESGLTHTQWGPAVRHRELSLKEYTLCADLNGKEIQKKKNRGYMDMDWTDGWLTQLYSRK